MVAEGKDQGDVEAFREEACDVSEIFLTVMDEAAYRADDSSVEGASYTDCLVINALAYSLAEDSEAAERLYPVGFLHPAED